MGSIVPTSTAQFKIAAKDLEAGTASPDTGEAVSATVEACAASLLPPTAMCELVLNLRATKSSWRTLLELHTLRK